MSSRLLDNLTRPIIQAPMGGGPSKPELAAAVARAGGLGFLAAGYKSAEDVASEIAATRKLTDRFGLNLFVPGPRAQPERYGAYVDGLREETPEAGEPRWTDDEWEAKLELLRREPVAAVLTRAFTGRRARGIANRFLREHRDAPAAYPEVHYATAPIRAAARKRGDSDDLNLWAGQAHALAREEPAADVVARLDAEARQAFEAALRADS